MHNFQHIPQEYPQDGGRRKKADGLSYLSLPECIYSNQQCNTKSGKANTWLIDEGYVTDKSILPVLKIHTSDKGSHSPGVIKFRIGPLECRGSLETLKEGARLYSCYSHFGTKARLVWLDTTDIANRGFVLETPTLA